MLKQHPCFRLLDKYRIILHHCVVEFSILIGQKVIYAHGLILRLLYVVVSAVKLAQGLVWWTRHKLTRWTRECPLTPQSLSLSRVVVRSSSYELREDLDTNLDYECF